MAWMAGTSQAMTIQRINGSEKPGQQAVEKARSTVNASESRGERNRIGTGTLFTISTAC
jgi:hypothetical protein